jgi:hypothetical protein
LAALLGVALALSIGCSDHVAPVPVAECRQYEALVASCFHRPPSGFASQASLIPKTKAEREKIRQTCSTNFERMQVACR